MLVPQAEVERILGAYIARRAQPEPYETMALRDQFALSEMKIAPADIFGDRFVVEDEY